MPVEFFYIQISQKIKRKIIIRKWIQDVIFSYKKKAGKINIILTNDNYILNINKEHLSKDYLTDIITFNFNRNNVISGDLYISLDRVKENSVSFGVSVTEELLRVIIHGILHLLGLDDKTEEQRAEIRKAEDTALQMVNKIEII